MNKKEYVEIKTLDIILKILWDSINDNERRIKQLENEKKNV